MPPPDIETIIAGAALDAGVEPAAAREALIDALGLLEKHGDPEAMEALYAQIEGARRVALSPEAEPHRGGGLFGGIMRGAGGVSGKAISDAMGMLKHLKTLGVDKDELKRLLPAARERVRQATGQDLLGDAVKSVPGVGALLGGD